MLVDSQGVEGAKKSMQDVICCELFLKNLIRNQETLSKHMLKEHLKETGGCGKQKKMDSYSKKNTADYVEISWPVRAGTTESGSELLLRTEVSQEHRGVNQESSRDGQNLYTSDQKSD